MIKNRINELHCGGKSIRMDVDKLFFTDESGVTHDFRGISDFDSYLLEKFGRDVCAKIWAMDVVEGRDQGNRDVIAYALGRIFADVLGWKSNIYCETLYDCAQGDGPAVHMMGSFREVS